MTAIGCDQTKLGKEGLQQIIKDDIHSNDYRFQVEASGTIEHYFEKFGGYNIHNSFAKQILGEHINIELDADGFHYTRIIGRSKIKVKKVIFGFANDNVFHATSIQLNSIEFSTEKLTESNIFKDLNKSIKAQVKKSYVNIETIYQSNEEDDINELFPDQYDLLIRARDKKRIY